MPRNVSTVAAEGDRLKTLEALRGRLADGIDRAVDGKELAALALRLQTVLREIAELGGSANEGEGDVLAERRRAKLSAASNS